MVAALRGADLGTMRMRERIAFALKARLTAMDDARALGRSAALFALPANAAQGGRLLWETADAAWSALGDRSRDGNWYTKRATLAPVFSAAVLYWLGDNSAGHADTRAFIDRRIGDVMRIERLKAGLRDLPGAAPLTKLATGWIRKPRPAPAPGHRGRA